MGLVKIYLPDLGLIISEVTKLKSQEFIDRLLVVIEDKCNGKQNLLAEAAKAPTSTVHNWLSEGRAPKPENLASLCKSLNVNLNWLIAGQGEKYIEPDTGKKPLSTVRAAEMILNLELADEESRGQIETILEEALKEQGKEYIRLNRQSWKKKG